MDRALARSLVAELIGTFALVFAGAGAIMVDAKTHALGHVGVAIIFGLVIMAMIYAVGHVSGAHFNPAVSLAFALTRHFPWTRVGTYWLAQLAGAVAAPGILRASLGDSTPTSFGEWCKEVPKPVAKVTRSSAYAGRLAFLFSARLSLMRPLSRW
jgi:glycerol uptake facilitator-like aquaporin